MLRHKTVMLVAGIQKRILWVSIVTENLCAMPWSSLMINPNGEVHPCCIISDNFSYGNVNKESIEEIINGDKIKYFRTQFMNNERPEQCRTCYESEEKYGTSMRMSSKGYLVDDMLENTNEDGHYDDFKLRYWDIRPSNLCNFSCVICCSALSSSVWDLNHKLGYPQQSTKFLKNDNWDKTRYELKNRIQEAHIIYFAGGEPLIMKEHYDMLNDIIECKPPNLETIRYNTNLSTLSFKGSSIVDKWNTIDTRIVIDASIDSAGLPGEFQRLGSKWQNVKANLKYLVCNDIELSFNMVISIITINNVYDTIVELEEIISREKLISVLRFTPLENPQVYDFRLLPNLDTTQIDKLSEMGYDVEPLRVHIGSKDLWMKTIDYDKLKHESITVIKKVSDISGMDIADISKDLEEWTK